MPPTTPSHDSGAEIVALGPGAGAVAAGQSRTTGACVVAVAVMSAVAAATSGAHPTGVGFVDVCELALLGAGCAVAGALAAWPYLACASLVATVATIGHPTVVASTGALGISAAALWSRFGSGRRELTEEIPGLSPIAGSAVGAVLAQVALRLEWPSHPRWPSAVAAVIVLLVLVPALWSAPRLVRRVLRYAMAGVIVVALGLTAWAGICLLGARSSLTEAINTTHLGLHAAELGQRQTARTDFATAADQFSAAQSKLSSARLAEVVPVVSEQVRAVRVGASIGDQLAVAARDTAARTDVQALRVSNGVFPVHTLEHLGPLFSSDLATLRSALSETGVFSSPWLVSPLRSKLTAEVSKLHQADHDATTALLAVRAVPVMLGADGIRHYLLLFENPAESRASGGVDGDYAELSASGGKMHLDKVGSVADLNSSGSPSTRKITGPKDYLARYSQFAPQESWENVPMSPDFPSVGDVAAQLYPQSGGIPVNGVISLDPVAMSGFLAATGPVSVPPWPGLITKNNVVGILGHQEFVQFASNDAERVAFVQALIKIVWHELITRPLPAIPQLAHDLLPALKGGHLLLYSHDARAEQFFTATHVSGSFPPVEGDFLGVVSQNAAGNKLDWYIRRSIDYRAELNRSTDQLNATLSVTLTNTAPKTGVPPFVENPSPGVDTSPGEDELYVSLYSPWEADGATLDGAPVSMTDQRELGRFVYSAFVKIPASSKITIVLHLIGHWHGHEPYHLTQYHQPVLFPDSVRTSFRASG